MKNMRMKKTPAMRAMLKRWPVGLRVRTQGTGWTGVVVGHRLEHNAQGGRVRVRWDEASRARNQFAPTESYMSGPYQLEEE